MNGKDVEIDFWLRTEYNKAEQAARETIGSGETNKDVRQQMLWRMEYIEERIKELGK